MAIKLHTTNEILLEMQTATHNWHIQNMSTDLVMYATKHLNSP